MSSNYIRCLFRPTKRLDGGWSWIVCIAAFFIFVFHNAARGSFGVLYIGLLQRFTNGTSQGNNTAPNVSDATCDTQDSGGISGTIAAIGSLQTTIVCVFGPPSAQLSSRFSVRGVIIVAAIVYSLGIYLTTYASQVWQAFLTYALLAGIGSGLIYTPVSALLAFYFVEYLPIASALSISGKKLGSAAFTPIARWILRDFGLNTLILSHTILALAIALTAILIRPPPQTSSVDATTQEQEQPRQTVITYWAILKHKQFMLWCLALSFHFFAFYLPTFHLIRYAECSLKVDNSQSGLLLTYHFIAAAIGGIGLGALASRIHNRIALQAFTLLLNALPNFFFPLYTTYAHVAVYSVVTGILMGTIVLNVIVCRDLLGSNAAIKGYGVYTFCTILPVSLGPTLAGWLYDVFQSYEIPFVIAGGIDLLASILMFISASTSAMECKADQEDPLPSITRPPVGLTWIESTV